jgi:hypothetical protein
MLFSALGAGESTALFLASPKNRTRLIALRRKNDLSNVSSEVLSIYTRIATDADAIAPDCAWWNARRSGQPAVQEQR